MSDAPARTEGPSPDSGEASVLTDVADGPSNGLDAPLFAGEFLVDLENGGRYADEAPAATAIRGGRGASLGVLAARAPELLVALAVLFGLIVLASQRLPVAYPNDSSVHSLTVAFATQQLEAGHFPLDGWFPFLSLGSPFFLHYQSISAVLTGLLGMLIGPANAFGWTLYLLLATWPIAIYIGARLLNLDRWTAALAAAASPLIFSSTGYGLEHQSYNWYGSGLWSQLWGMWLLPLAVGWTWRAISQRRDVVPAVVSFGLLISFHFLTAYFVGLLVVCYALLRPRQLWRRLLRVVGVGAASALLAAWVLIPLVMTDRWAATNEFEVGRFWDDGYGARRVLGDLVTGRAFDSSLVGTRFPILTILAAIGLVACLVTFRRDERSRVVVVIGVLGILLTSGRTTFHAAANLLPYSSQVLFHRYVMAIDLAGILLMGIGLESTGRVLASLGTKAWSVLGRRRRRSPLGGALLTLALLGATIAVLAPAWVQIGSYDFFNATQVRYQQQVDANQGAQVDALLARAERLGGGRIYAGLPSNWGRQFVVGAVPVYIYLADREVDAVGFTLRTSSLMTGPEAYFNELVPGDYVAFGVRFLLLPTGHVAPVPATFLQQDGNYTLWQLPTSGYIHLVDTVPSPIVADGTNLGRQSGPFLNSALISEGRYPTVAFDGAPAAPATLAADAPTDVGPPGQVVSERDDLRQGEASATVAADRSAVVLLSASYDGGWRVEVDGRPATPEMVAPALVGVTVSPGVHTVSFRYQAFSYYPELFALALLTLVALVAWPSLRRRLTPRRPRPDGEAGRGPGDAEATS